MKVDQVVISGVRGIRGEITILLAGRSLLLHGDNGTGKSSVERSLRWALTGDGEPTDEEAFSSESSFRRHVLVAPKDPFVRIEFRGGSRIDVRPGVFDAHGKGEAIRRACVRGSPFLRRTELLNVLTDRPVDRFRYFEGFLGLDQVDALLKELGDSKSASERRANSLETALQNELEALRPLLPEELRASAGRLEELERAALSWALQLGVPASQAAWSDVQEALRAALQSSDTEVEQRRSGLQGLSDELSAVEARWKAEVVPHPETLTAELDKLGVVPSASLELLRHAERHFASTEGEICPVCEQRVDWAATAAEIKRRIADLDEYARLVDRRASALRKWWGRWADLARLRENTEKQVGESCAWDSLKAALPGMDLLLDLQADGTEEARLEALRTVGGKNVDEFLGSVRAELAAAVTAALSALPKLELRPDISLCESLFTRVSEKRAAMALSAAELSGLREELAVQSKLYEAVRKARQDVARDTLDKIAEKVGEYYFSIHPRELPDEATGAPSIDVQRHSGGTAFVRGVFAERPIKDPRWVYSDGHLDTVGICIFLALRRFRGNEPDDARLLVLDDIIVSIDLGHARRLLYLLRDEFADHQLFMLTHNGLFARWCIGILPGLARMEIKAWSLESGPRIGGYDDAYETLKESLTSASPKEISQHMMTLLDEWLGEARYAYELSVPAKRDEAYTLTDIWEPFGAALRKMAKKMGSDLGGASTHLDALKDVPQIRNYLSAHENEFAQEFPRKTIVDVAESVLALVESLYCRECVSFAEPIPRRNDPSIVHCRCKKIMYVPEVADQES